MCIRDRRSETYAPGKHYLNAMRVAYLPADDPQIAIGISIEYGGYGARTGDLVVDIANAYFALDVYKRQCLFRAGAAKPWN